MDERKMNRNSTSANHKTVSKKKTSNVSYRTSRTSKSTRPASKKQAASNRRTSSVDTDTTLFEQPVLRNRFANPKDSSKKEKKTSTGSSRQTTPRKEKTTKQITAKSSSAMKRKPKKKRLGCLPVVLLLVLVIGLGVFGTTSMIRSAFKKIEKTELNMDNIVVNKQDSNMSGYQNIALFGVDNQDNEIYDKGSRTDCIMVASINKRSKKIKLLSIYRDTYVSIDGKYDKINAAYSYGGPELAISTINRNLDLNITDFATVNFKALADAVDILGGVELTVKSQKELENLNDYIGNMNKINGGNSPKFDAPASYPFTATFDGNQAVAYSRIRYMAGGDHERANHQRIVVTAIIKAAKKQPWKLKKLIDGVLPQCKTSLSTSKMMSMSLSLPRYDIADSQAYPFKSFDEKYNGIYYGFPVTTYSNTIEAHKYLFGTKDYEPTQELCLISEKVKNITEMYGY